jgi:hypothetical protein
MNTFIKSMLRVAAVLIGTAYFCATYFLVLGAPHLDNFGSFIGYGAAALAQFLVGGFLVGLGVWRFAR